MEDARSRSRWQTVGVGGLFLDGGEFDDKAQSANRVWLGCDKTARWLRQKSARKGHDKAQQRQDSQRWHGDNASAEKVIEESVDGRCTTTQVLHSVPASSCNNVAGDLLCT